MSTRSYICKENEDGTFTGVYCHSDGYLSYNGAMLLDHYSEREKVEHLISLGDLSLLCEKIDPDPAKPHSFDYNDRQEDVTVAYGRDRGETGIEAKEVKLNEFDSDDSWIEYIYVYGKDDKWRYFEGGLYGKTGLKDVETDLAEEYKEMGIDRPKGYYGYFSPESIAEIKAEQAAAKNKDVVM